MRGSFSLQKRLGIEDEHDDEDEHQSKLRNLHFNARIEIYGPGRGDRRW